MRNRSLPTVDKKNYIYDCKMITYMPALLLCGFMPKNLPIHVAPMSTWLGYTLQHVDAINELVPLGTRVAPMKILSDDVAEPKLLFNIYESKSTFFSGLRFEVVTIVEQKRNPKNVHFVVLECLSNTLQWDPKQGIILPNLCSFSKFNDKKIEISCHQWGRKLSFKGDFGNEKSIHKMFAVDANYQCFFQDCSEGVKLSFDENQIMQDVKLLTNLYVDTNIWQDFRGDLTHCFLHPHHMDFTADFFRFYP